MNEPPVRDGSAGSPPGGSAETHWLSGPSLRLHAALLGGLTGCGIATWFEWTRAHAGHQVAWVYTFEWPLFAVLGLHLWWRLLHADQPRAARQLQAPIAAPEPPDAELAAWQAYVQRLENSDPPGGPPDQVS